MRNLIKMLLRGKRIFWVLGTLTVLLSNASCGSNLLSNGSTGGGSGISNPMATPTISAWCTTSGGLAPVQVGSNCPGYTSSPQPSPVSYYTAGPADTTVMAAALPTPFDPSLPLSLLGNISLPNLYTTSAQNIRRPMSAVALANDHEGLGDFLTQTLPPTFYNAAFATESAYEASQSPVVSQGATGRNQIFAPTLHFGQCLENSTFYDGDGSLQGTTAHFTVYNFCLSSPKFIYDTQITQAFLNAYVRINPANNLPSYTTEIFTPDNNISGNSTWYSILYDYQTSKYDLVSSSSVGGGAQMNFWSMYEGYFAQGPCPILAPIGASGIAFHNSNDQSWELVVNSMPGGAQTEAIASTTASSSNSCMLPNATINVKFLIPNSSWEGVSPKNS
jgi:hypothetical protein